MFPDRRLEPARFFAPLFPRAGGTRLKTALDVLPKYPGQAAAVRYPFEARGQFL